MSEAEARDEDNTKMRSRSERSAELQKEVSLPILVNWLTDRFLAGFLNHSLALFPHSSLIANESLFAIFFALFSNQKWRGFALLAYFLLFPFSLSNKAATLSPSKTSPSLRLRRAQDKSHYMEGETVFAFFHF
jgi:hypothetical protein